MEALWDKFVTAAPRSRALSERNTAIASFAHAAEQGTGHQPEDGGEVAEARDGRGYAERADGTTLDGFD
jgi:hypothetical protein